MISQSTLDAIRGTSIKQRIGTWHYIMTMDQWPRILMWQTGKLAQAMLGHRFGKEQHSSHSTNMQSEALELAALLARLIDDLDWTSLGLGDIAPVSEHAMSLISNESHRQDKKWGEQNHDPEIWLSILTEELGELAGVFSLAPSPAVREEAIQAAAVVGQFIDYLIRAGIVS